MDDAEEKLLKFIKLFAIHHPKDVQVHRVEGNPVVYEITVNSKDEKETRDYLCVYQAIIGCSTQMISGQYEIRILVK